MGAVMLKRRHRLTEVDLPPVAHAVLRAGILSLSWLVIVILAGWVATINLGAASAWLGDRLLASLPEPVAAAEVLGAPRLDPPPAVTNQPTMTLAGVLPDSAPGRPAAINISDNGRVVAVAPVPTTIDFRIAGVPLDQGPNLLTATLATGTASAVSPPVMVVRDSATPGITLTGLDPKVTAMTALTTITGSTDAGSAVTVTNDRTDGGMTVSADAAGQFSVIVALAGGANHLTIRVTNVAGTSASTTVTITRG